MSSYLSYSEKKLLKTIANKIVLYYNVEVPFNLTEEEMLLIRRLRIVHDVDKTLILKDFQNAFPNMTEEDADYVMEMLFGDTVL